MITKEEPKPVPENDPSISVRTDLWNTMSVTQLNRQRELLLDNISRINSLMTGIANPSIINIHAALQLGLDDITKLIDYKAAQKR